MLARGNVKLGRSILSWSLPAVTTCPGATETCLAVCYARKNHFRRYGNPHKYRRNLQRSRRKNFVEKMLQYLEKRKPRVVRIHVSGDFYDVNYIRKWCRIIERSPQIRFYSYTRSWSKPNLLKWLKKLASYPNMSLWFSCDRSSGTPPRISKARRGYLSLHDGDNPKCKVDLVFRNQPKTPLKRVDGTLVCPVEQAVTKEGSIKCNRCRICFDQARAKVLLDDLHGHRPRSQRRHCSNRGCSARSLAIT